MNIGKIISVEYDKFRVKLFHTTKTSTISIKGQVYYFGNIGSFLKCENVTGDRIICEVVSVLDHISESKLFSDFNLDSSRELVIKPVGSLSKANRFSMGVGIFPSIYSDVGIVTIDELQSILSPIDEVKDIEQEDIVHNEISIGYSKNLINYNVKINIDKLFNIHTAVLGNSGSGKSNTIAHILQDIYRKDSLSAIGAKTILFDVNGEYHKAFSKNLQNDIDVIFYKPNNNLPEFEEFHLPYYLMSLEEWLAFLMASERTQKPFWDKVLQESFKFYKIIQNQEAESTAKFSNYFKWKIRNILTNIMSQADNDTSKITAAQGVIIKCRNIVAESGIALDINEFLNELHSNCVLNYGKNDGHLISYLNEAPINEELAVETDSERLHTGGYFDFKFLKTAVDIVLLEEEAKGNSRIREFTSTMLSRLDYFLNNPDCLFMKNCQTQYTKEEYLKSYFGLCNTNLKNQLIIIDSSEVSTDILELMTSVVSRMIYDYRKSKNGIERIQSPVHLLLDEAHRYIRKDVEYIIKDNIFERIAREGRKFSLYLLISSQRPSELSSTVLSQCGNYIIHRIQNEADMKYILSVLPYFSSDYVTKIKQLVPGEALIFGNCVPMPLLVMVTQANPDPSSENCSISKEWFLPLKDKSETISGIITTLQENAKE